MRDAPFLWNYLILAGNMSSGNCTDNGCESQWQNQGRCVDFSNTDMKFEHLEATFNLSSGSIPGLCGHNSNRKKDCCHCLQMVKWDGDCVKLAPDSLSTLQIKTSYNTIDLCIDTCKSSNFNYAGVFNGSTCWCGNLAPSPEDLRPGQCDIPCPGNIGQICGATSAMNIFDLNCEDSVPTAATTIAIASTSASAITTTSADDLILPQITAATNANTCVCPSTGEQQYKTNVNLKQ